MEHRQVGKTPRFGRGIIGSSPIAPAFWPRIKNRAIQKARFRTRSKFEKARPLLNGFEKNNVKWLRFDLISKSLTR